MTGSGYVPSPLRFYRAIRNERATTMTKDFKLFLLPFRMMAGAVAAWYAWKLLVWATG